MSTRYRMTVEYHGGPMVGFQRQTNGMSVQQALEDAFAKFCGHEVRIFGSGRTDAGVHAEGQVVHVDLEEPIAARTIMGAANFHMKPLPVAVLDCEEVSSDFHARFDAIARHYRYLIINRRAPLALVGASRTRASHPLRSTPLPARSWRARTRTLAISFALSHRRVPSHASIASPASRAPTQCD